MKKIHFILIAILFLFATQASAVSFTTNEALRRGSSGVDVLTLQQFLVSNGYLMGEIDGTFGVKTETAVKAFQFAQGLGADGVVGKDTKLRITGGQVLGISTTTTMPVTTKTTTTGVSSTTSVEATSEIKEFKDPQCNGVFLGVKRSPTSPTSDIESGDENADIAIFSLKTGSCSVKISSADVIVMNMDTEGPMYDKMTVIGGSSVVASGADPYDRETINFSNFTIPANTEKTITINLDEIEASNDVDHNAIAAGLLSLKGSFSNGMGFNIDTAGIWGHVLDVKGGSTEPVNAELEVSSSNKTPIAQIVEVDQTDDTDDVPLLVFELEATGDITVDGIPVLIEAEGLSVTHISSDFHLKIYETQEELDYVLYVIGGNDDDLVVNFDDVGLEIEDGESILLGVYANIHDIEPGEFEEGDSLIASITDDEIEEISAEDADGDALDEDDITGGAVGNTQTFYSEGIVVEIEEIDVEKTFTADDYGEADQGTFTFEYNITAYGMDVVIDKSCKEDGTNIPDQGTEYSVLMNTSNTTACSVTSTASTYGSDTGSWIIEEGETESFTLTVLVVPTIDQTVGVNLESINWDNIGDTSPDKYADAPAVTVPVLFLNKY